MSGDSEYPAPRTRSGGQFSAPSEVNLHANDFSIREKYHELTSNEKSLLKAYAEAWDTALACRVRGPRRVHQAAAQQPWESHYASSRHSFPLKNYIIHAFPALAKFVDGSVEKPAILECGCGSGSTLLPLMKYASSKDVVFVGFDVSATSVRYFSEHEVAQDYAKDSRLFLFTHDAADDADTTDGSDFEAENDGTRPKRSRKEPSQDALSERIASKFPILAQVKYDAVLLIFVLSALPTCEDMRVALRQLHRTMKPGGVLLFRDYALPDHNFFRFLSKTNDEIRNGIVFTKGDGTTQVFFDENTATQLFRECGFDVESIQYHCNRIVNRKNGKRMDKVFINGTFRGRA